MPSPEPSDAPPPLPEAGELLARLADRAPLRVCAVHLGHRLATREVHLPRLGPGPELVAAGPDGVAALFRFGVAVFYHAGPEPDPDARAAIEAAVVGPFEEPEEEDAIVVLAPGEPERGSEGQVTLEALTLDRLHVVADVMAKTVVLAQYEAVAQGAFDQVEPLAERIGRKHPARGDFVPILQHIGATLVAETKVIGRVRVTEKPDLLWDHPELERLWGRLSEEYELAERYEALERQLTLIDRTARTALGLIQERRTLRVEWYIVLLIVAEIGLQLYDLFLR